MGKNNEGHKDLIQTYAEYSDAEVLNVLKKRSHYQEEAAKLAVSEALKRGLILSENDLPADEFKVEPLQVRLFPPIHNNQNRMRIVKGLSRSMLLVGAVPFIHGIVNVFDHNLIEGIALILLGGIWLVSAFLLMKKQVAPNVNTLIILVFLSIIYTVKLFLGRKGIPPMDYAIAVVLYSAVFYCLFYIRRLLKMND